MIKLCAFDMDGTLLNGDEVISKENKLALGRLEERGIGIVLATGRPELFVRNYKKELALKLPLVSCNGAIVRDSRKGELVHSVEMEKDACLQIVEICTRYGLYFQAFTMDSMYLLKDDPVLNRIYRLNGEYGEGDQISFFLLPRSSDLADVGEPIYRIKVDISDGSLKEKVEAEVNLIPGITACFSDSGLLECIHEGASKGNALRIICRNMGIEPHQVAAFGDSFNDLSMFEFAGLSVAMGNGDERVKARAKFVTRTNDESGVAYGINNFIL